MRTDVHAHLWSEGYLDRMASYGREDTIAAMQLILAGYPSRYPRLRIVNSHLGGALPMLLPRADEHCRWEAPDVVEPPTVAARRMWYDTVAHGRSPAVRLAAESYGADRLLLGTDFPYQSGDQLPRAVDFLHAALALEEAQAVASRATKPLPRHPDTPTPRQPGPYGRNASGVGADGGSNTST
ncbi:amidohydrolase family protein [Kitasatospora sp. NPDC056138]|uniref:amidohydrolase family protein n=1 Tax=Kitasatospora sp. NPDC056138 TaxID=3345724 RepID=UPI0035D7E9CE